MSYLKKLKKSWFLHTHRNQVFKLFINNSRFKQDKTKSGAPFCRQWVKTVCKISVKNIKLYGSWISSKFSIFQASNLVSANNRSLSKFRYQILHYLISVIKLQKNQFMQFQINFVNHLNLKNKHTRSYSKTIMVGGIYFKSFFKKTN